MSDRDEPSGGRRHKPHGIVRPYVLGAGDSADRSQPQRDFGDRQTRHDQPALDWTSDPRSRGTHDTRFTSTHPDAPMGPRPTTARLPAPKPAGNHGWMAGRRRLAAIGVGLAALAILAGTILLLSRPSSKLVPSACSSAGCPQGATRAFGGNPPPVGAPASGHKALRRSHPTATHSTARPSPAPTRPHPTPSPTRSSPAPTPTATPTPTPSPSPGPQQSVKVTYAVVSQHPHSFQGQFTIVNDGNTAIKGWELVVVLPNDRIHAVWDGVFHVNGDTLYIDPSKSQQTIAPGATLIENLSAHGSTSTPTSCTFNGSAC
jgi:hypothetical protein